MHQGRVSVPRRVTSIRRSSAREKCAEFLKSFQKSLDGDLAIVVSCADGETALDLASEFSDSCSGAFTDNQKVVGMPAEVLCLEVNLRYEGFDQDRRNTSHEQLYEPVRCDMLLEEDAGSASGGRTRCVLFSQIANPLDVYKSKRRWASQARTIGRIFENSRKSEPLHVPKTLVASSGRSARSRWDVSRGSWKKNGALHSVIRVSDQLATSACSRTSLRPW